MPNDPIMLMSYVNTKIRDSYRDLQDFCASEGVEENELKEKLSKAGFEYDIEKRQFL